MKPFETTDDQRQESLFKQRTMLGCSPLTGRAGKPKRTGRGSCEQGSRRHWLCARPYAGHQLQAAAQGDHGKQSMGFLAAKPLSSAWCIAAILISKYLTGTFSKRYSPRGHDMKKATTDLACNLVKTPTSLY